MRIVFLGTPAFTLPILEACRAGGELVAVVAQPDRPVGRSGRPQPPPAKAWAQERGIEVLQPEKVKGGRLASLLGERKPDVAVVAAYGRILPADAPAAPRPCCLHAHASPWPPLLAREDGKVASPRGAAELDRRRRGFSPWPGAFTARAGGVLKIHAARPLEAAADAAAAPGTVVAAGAAGIDVACGERSLWRLLELQPEGKKRMPAAAYLAGNPLREGERLGD